MRATVSSRRTIWRPGAFRARWLLQRASEIAESAAVARLGRSFDVTSFSWMLRVVVKSRVAIVVSASRPTCGCARLRNFASFCNLSNVALNKRACTLNTPVDTQMLASDRTLSCAILHAIIIHVPQSTWSNRFSMRAPRNSSVSRVVALKSANILLKEQKSIPQIYFI